MPTKKHNYNNTEIVALLNIYKSLKKVAEILNCPWATFYNYYQKQIKIGAIVYKKEEIYLEV